MEGGGELSLSSESEGEDIGLPINRYQDGFDDDRLSGYELSVLIIIFALRSSWTSKARLEKTPFIVSTTL